MTRDNRPHLWQYAHEFDKGELMLFSDFLAIFPAVERAPEVLQQSKAFRSRLELDPRYVTPTISVTGHPQGACVALVEAAGAVGKSAAARAIAARLRWPLVLSEQAQVGSYSLSGLMQDCLGFSGDYIRQVATGVAGVVIDSLDEAHFKAGTQNLFAFLENIQGVSGATIRHMGRQAPSIILMARSDTAELIKLHFLDQDLPLLEARLDFFDLFSARKYIDVYFQGRRETLPDRPEYRVPFASPGPFERLREDRFRQVASMLLRRQSVDLSQDWSNVAEFLGYQPVLAALAEYLAVTNPAAEMTVRRIEGGGDEFLRDIALSILKREQGKFAERVLSRLLANLPASVDETVAAEDLYTPHEQCIRILAAIGGATLEAPIPQSLPADVKPLYEQAASVFCADHPFLRNREFASLVFADYVTARTATDAVTSVALPRHTATSVQVGPFFVGFFRQACPDVPVPEGLLQQLIISWLLENDLIGGGGSSSWQLTLFESGEAQLELRRFDEGERVLTFDIAELTGAVHLSSGLRDGLLITDRGVILGDRSVRLSLGPGLAISAKEVDIQAEAVDVETDSKGRGVAIGCETLTANFLTVVDARPGALHLFSKNPPPRLRPYVRQLTTGVRQIPFSDYVDLRAVLTAFGRSAGSSPSVYYEKLDKAIVGSRGQRQKIVQRLLEIGVITREGDLYRLDLSALGRLGFNLSDITRGMPTPALLRFLGEVRFLSE